MRAVMVLLLAGCVSSVTPAPAVRRAPPAPPVHVPDGCLRDLSGNYAHTDDPSYTYSARDDGGTLVLIAGRTFTDGGTGAGAPVITLQRGPDGFRGETKALAGLPSGETREVTFATSVQGCPGDGLVLESAADSRSNRNPVMLVHKLTRADAGAKSQTP
jgi:hypothetical protein